MRTKLTLGKGDEEEEELWRSNVTVAVVAAAVSREERITLLRTSL